ncbi:MAG: DNA polymerase III subunit gamma/tau [Anaerolineales bacterium]
MTQVLYREWRPQTWDEVVGQDHVVQTLRNAVRAERLAHAYLFAGPRGTGKTTTARLLAKAANCLAEATGDRPCNRCTHCLAVNAGRFLDLIEIDAASNTSVDDVRELRERINFSPNEGRFKVYIVDEVHMLSTAAFNALLKTLEEPPSHAIFILATTEVHKIPATVLSRCQRHEFRRIPVAVISEYLDRQIAKQGYRLDGESVDFIARQSTGSLRDAISLLDQMVSTGEQVTLSLAQQVLGTASTDVVWELLETLVDGRIGKGLTVLNRALDAGVDPRQLARQVVTALRAILLIQMGELPSEQASGSDHPRLQGLAGRLQLDPLLNALRAFSQATRTQPGNWQPGLALELAYLEAIHPERPKPDPEPPAASRPAAGQPSGAGHEQPRQADADREQNRQAPSVVDFQAEPPRRRPAVRDRQPGAAQAGYQAAQETGEIEFQAVLDSWPKLLAAAYRRDPRAQALLNSSKPMGVSPAGLVLGFQSDLLREKMEKGHNAQLIAEALEEVLGGPLGVRCVLIEEWEAKLTTAAPPVQEGGMVAMALRDLGGQVVDFEQLPPQAEDGGEAA